MTGNHWLRSWRQVSRVSSASDARERARDILEELAGEAPRTVEVASAPGLLSAAVFRAWFDDGSLRDYLFVGDSSSAVRRWGGRLHELEPSAIWPPMRMQFRVEKEPQEQGASPPARADLTARAIGLRSAVAALVLLPTVMFAQAFDGRAYCKHVREMGSGTAVTEDRCLQLERESLVKLAGMTVAPQIAAHCEDVARVTGGTGSYSIMLGCVLREMDARSELPANDARR